MASKWLLITLVLTLASSILVKGEFDEASNEEASAVGEPGSGVDMLWPYLYGYSGENMPSKRVLPYIVHKRMPYIVHKRMPYIVHKRMMSEELGREEIARILDKYQPRALRMIPLIH